MKFSDLKLSEKTLRALETIGYTETTEIQEKAIPEIQKGSDLIGLSQTGTGKTAAFGIPTIENVDVKSKKTQVLILAPTRELAVQITDELRRFTKYTDGLKMLTVYGGQSIEKQIIPLRKGVQIVVGTPGRIMDHMRKKTLKLSNVKIVILDEADEMLNMGFREDIETILQEVPEDRQTLLFSATMNDKIMAITKKYLKNPKKIKIKSKELTVENINQIAFQTKNNMKDEITARVIDLYNPKKLIVFCNTKSLCRLLVLAGSKVKANLASNVHDGLDCLVFIVSGNAMEFCFDIVSVAISDELYCFLDRHVYSSFLFCVFMK